MQHPKTKGILAVLSIVKDPWSWLREQQRLAARLRVSNAAVLYGYRNESKSWRELSNLTHVNSGDLQPPERRAIGALWMDGHSVQSPNMQPVASWWTKVKLLTLPSLAVRIPEHP